jgi:hypothetical protein
VWRNALEKTDLEKEGKIEERVETESYCEHVTCDPGLDVTESPCLIMFIRELFNCSV